MPLYFAYGSNMASARLGARVPSARALGPARLEGWAWRCNKRGADGTAKANLVREPGAASWGVLYEMDAGAFEVLDRVEGGYQRIEVRVAWGADEVRAQTYVSDRLADAESPARWYLALVLAGAREHALPDAWIASLEGPVAADEPAPGDPMVFDDPANACFGCSPRNPRGLGLSFTRLAAGRVETVYVAADDLCGKAGIVHGGVQAALMDEAMGFAAHAAIGTDGVDIATLSLALRYRRPTPTGVPITIRGRLVGSEGRDLLLEGEILDAEGRVCTEATSRWRKLAHSASTRSVPSKGGT